MKISELYKHVAQLGFEDSLEDDDRFYYAANRAILQVCKLRPAISYCTLNHKPLMNAINAPSFAPIERTEEVVYEATDVKAYYFEAEGNGKVYIEKYATDSDTWLIIDDIDIISPLGFTKYRGHIQDENGFIDELVRIRFTGDYLYTIRNVAMYKYILSPSEDDIPNYEAYTRYDIRTLTNNFMALCNPPILEGADNITLNQEYRTEGDSVVLIPYEMKGVFKIMYERFPNKVVDTGNATADNTDIDLDEELCSLLPLLIAAYVWVDDEPEKSQYYMNLYRERAVDIERRVKNQQPVQYRNINGW